MWILAFFIFANTLLDQAETVSKNYALEVAKLPPPSRSPLTQKCLDSASVWFTIELDQVACRQGQSVFAALNIEDLWSRLSEMGVEAVHLAGLKQGGSQRTGLSIDKTWGTTAEWEQLASTIQKKGIALIADAMGNSLGITEDFALALKNNGDYPSLYHLIEIDQSDWKLLPVIAQGRSIANVPWLSLQELYKKGYVPEQFAPYVKESDWNATEVVIGDDQKKRRWIYLKKNQADPVIDWLGASFAGMRIAAADALESFYKQGISFFHLDADLSSYAQENLPLWIRKLGAFTVQQVAGGVDKYKTATSDLVYDSATRAALLHALISGDAEVLRIMYRLFLNANVPMKRLVHQLQPFDKYPSDWAEFSYNPKKSYRYYEEYLTGDALQRKVMKQDLAMLKEQGLNLEPKTWVGYCTSALGNPPLENVQSAHLLLAFFYAMQPGGFSFSVSDLLGADSSSEPCFDLMGINESTLYPSFPIQFLNPSSFAMGLKQILSVRKKYDLGSGELLDVVATEHPSVLILLYKLRENHKTEMLAVNFGRKAVEIALENSLYRERTAINLMTGLAENKSFQSTQFKLRLEALSGKAILFQPKYYD